MRLRPRIEPEPPRELKFRVPAETYAELELYSRLYAEEYDQEIDIPTLAGEILQQFLSADRALRSYKRRQGRPNGAAAGKTDGAEAARA